MFLRVNSLVFRGSKWDQPLVPLDKVGGKK